MTQGKFFRSGKSGWKGIGAAAVLSALLLFLLSFSIGLAAPEAVVLQSMVGDNWLTIDTAVLDSAVSSGYGTDRSESILGFERDLFYLQNGLRLEWDGDEGDPTSLDETGLGGYDLTARGFMDHVALTVNALNQPVQATLTVFTDEGKASAYVMDLNQVGQLVVPLSAFEAVLGSGADFSDVGAIVLQVQGSTAGLELGALQMGSSLTAERQVVLVVDENGNGKADPNDIVEHNIAIGNPGGSNSAPLAIVESVIGNQYGLVNGSVTANQGQVVSGNGVGQQVVNVALGSLAAGEDAAVSYRVSMLAGPPISVTVVVEEGDTPAGGGGDTVSTLNSPFTNDNGQVGFTGNLSTNGNFVWFNSGITWLNSDGLPNVLTGAEGTTGFSDSGGFNYSPSTDGNDSVWTQNGLLLMETTQAPGFPANTTNTFNSRPKMNAGGAAYWVSGFNASGGTSTEGRMLYTSPDAMTNTIAVVIRSDDVISGFVVDRPSGVDFDYWPSDNNSHLVSVLLMDTGSTTDDGFVYVDGALVARETAPSGDGDNWDNFDAVSINNAGDYLFSGDTDGATTVDEFIAYNGTTAIREGDTIGGVNLASSAFVNAISINDLGHGVYIWSVAGGVEILFSSCDMSDVANTTTALLATNDMVDVDGNGTADATVTDMNASGIIGPGLDLAEDGIVYLEVDLDYGVGDLEAIIGLPIGCSGGGGAPLIEVSPAGMISVQATDTQMTQTLTISNPGTADLVWSIDEQPAAANGYYLKEQTFQVDSEWGAVDVSVGGGCAPPTDGDIPWVSENPTTGTTTAGSFDDVAVTFDSTGISLGVQRASLCVNNNSITSTVEVPVVLEVPPAPAIVLSKTVGLDPNVCAASDTVNIPAGMGGTSVTYCYTVQNTGNITLSLHSLVDDQLGDLLGPDAVNDLAPGATYFYTVSTVITQTTVNTATWTSANSSGVHTDPTGDTIGVGGTQIDITDFSANSSGGMMTVQMAFDGAISPPGTGNPNDVLGYIEIDRDGSPLTGISFLTGVFCPSPSAIGVDYFVDLGSYNPGAGTVAVLYIDEFSMGIVQVGLAAISFTANSYTLNLPLSLFEVNGPEEGIMSLASVVGTTAEPTDCAPDGALLVSRVEVSDVDSATVTQNNPTGVALTGLDGAAPVALLPVWLLALALAMMVLPALYLRLSTRPISDSGNG